MATITLLMVDDDPRQLEILKQIAYRAGFDNVIGATSRRESDKLLEQGVKFQLAVIDLVLTELPEKLGLDLIAQLRATQPDCKIIALTARAGTSIGVEAILAGADDFVSTKWESVNWRILLEERLKLWRGVLDGLVHA
jgi:DNA-binding response OmpR family regulator